MLIRKKIMAGRKLRDTLKCWLENLMFTFFWKKVKILFYLEVIGFLLIISLEVLGVIWLLNTILR